MSTNQPDIKGMQRAVANALHQHWVLYLVEGVVLLILGLYQVPLIRTRAPIGAIRWT